MAKYAPTCIVSHQPAEATNHEEAVTYTMKWQGYGSQHNTEEPVANMMEDVPLLVQQYWERQKEHDEHALLMASEVKIPQTYEEAMSSQYAKEWREAMESEIASLKENGTYVINEAPKGQRIIDTKWVYELKTDTQGKIIRFKARFVAKGFMQRQGIDYHKVFAPTSKMTTMRVFMATAAARGLHIGQLDVKTAFLHGQIEVDTWVRQPRGFEEGGPRMACYLHKTLYGLCQAPEHGI
jgi:hypothetical protein